MVSSAHVVSSAYVVSRAMNLTPSLTTGLPTDASCSQGEFFKCVHQNIDRLVYFQGTFCRLRESWQLCNHRYKCTNQINVNIRPGINVSMHLNPLT